MTKNVFEYFMPTKIYFGKGQLDQLGEIQLPGKKALIVISNGTSMKKYGYLERVQTLLKKNGTESVVFAEIKPNPTLENVNRGAAMAREEKCDFIIGLGGGSSIDASKSIAIMATNDGGYWDYVNGGSGKGLPVPIDPLPVVAITTTAGTGTEADPWTVVTKEDTQEKIGYGYDKTFPAISFVDPDLMMSVPPKLTAYQGFDALFHAVEGYIATIATEISDMFALKSIELLGRSLPTAVNDGSNAEARADVALANTLSGFVESTSSCISHHSLEHALSAHHTDLPHGAGLIILSEAYFSHFASSVPEKFVNMAKALGMKDATKAEDFITALVSLQEKCGVRGLKMSDYGVEKDNLEKYAKNAFDTMGGLFDFDPSPLELDDTIRILEKAYF